MLIENVISDAVSVGSSNIITKDNPMAMDETPFSERDGLIWYNGELVDWRAADVHVLTHGLHYGSCVF